MQSSLQRTSLDRYIAHSLLKFHCWGKCVHSLHPLLWGREHREAWIWIPTGSTYTFPPYDPAVHLYYVTIMYLNYEYNYSVSPLVILLKLTQYLKPKDNSKTGCKNTWSLVRPQVDSSRQEPAIILLFEVMENPQSKVTLHISSHVKTD